MNQKMIITLTTDFGLEDAYVAEMKGVILARNPDVRLVDITHDIPPQDVLHASLVLWRSYRYFPRGTVHLVVVDPGVGTRRRLLIARSKRYFFLAPDNGILSPIILEERDVSLYAIDPRRVRSTPSSRTFEGRDILAPCAAALLQGIPPKNFGDPIPLARNLPQWRVSLRNHRLEGRILSKDHFGNLITNIRKSDYLRFKHQGKGKEVWFKSGRYIIKKLSYTYAEGGKGPMALFGSSDLLELAIRTDDASKRLPLRRGNPVLLIYGTK